MMDSEEPPQLEHGIPDPEVYLPETPEWYWALVGVTGALTLVLFWWLFRILKPSPRVAPIEPEDHFAPALAALDELESERTDRWLAEGAAEISLTLRRYLAGARSDPALFETAEEFAGRQTVLPERTSLFLRELNDTKYAKSEKNEARLRSLVKQARREIKHLRAVPRPETPPPPVRAKGPSARQLSAKILHAAVPVARLTASVSFVLGLYDGADTGSDLTLRPLTWVSLALAPLFLLAHLFLRPKT